MSKECLPIDTRQRCSEMQNPDKESDAKQYNQAHKKAKGIDPCNLVTLREREMTAGQVPVLSLYCKKEKIVQCLAQVSGQTRNDWAVVVVALHVR